VTVARVENSGATPAALVLHQSFPNPFNSGTSIGYALPSRSQVELAVFNLAGQRVATLVNAVLPAGSHAASWDGADEGGDQQASGLYLYRLRAGNRVTTRKLLLLR